MPRRNDADNEEPHLLLWRGEASVRFISSLVLKLFKLGSFSMLDHLVFRPCWFVCSEVFKWEQRTKIIDATK